MSSEPRQPIYSEAYYLPHSDRVEVKIRRMVPNEQGIPVKRGVIVLFSEEVLFNMAEGMEYCWKGLPDGLTRFQAIAEDIREELKNKPKVKEVKPSGIVYDVWDIIKSSRFSKHLKSINKLFKRE